jgi:hypothetical protein
MAAAVSFAPTDGLSIQNVETLDPSKLTPLTPEVISRQVRISEGPLDLKLAKDLMVNLPS